MLLVHFDWFCGLDTQNHCKGKRIWSGYDASSICFEYSEKRFAMGPKDYFMSFPVLNFNTKDENGNKIALKWYPSEYLYRDSDNKYCMAIEKFNRPGEILMGGSFMRQNNFIFDLENNKMGVSRARCNDDPNMILNEQEMITAGQRYGLDPTHIESLNSTCLHGR
jgi:Xylanase inhibitor C-terminal